MNPFIWFIPALLVFTGILALSTFLALPFQPEGFVGIDKLEHTFAYFVLILCLLIAFKKNQLLQKKTLLLLIIGCSLYGIALEVVQYVFFPNRYFEWWDAIANVSGVLIGTLIFRLVARG